MSNKRKTIIVYIVAIAANAGAAIETISRGKFNPATLIGICYCLVATIRICTMTERPRQALLTFCHLVRVTINSFFGRV